MPAIYTSGIIHSGSLLSSVNHHSLSDRRIQSPNNNRFIPIQPCMHVARPLCACIATYLTILALPSLACIYRHTNILVSFWVLCSETFSRSLTAACVGRSVADEHGTAHLRVCCIVQHLCYCYSRRLFIRVQVSPYIHQRTVRSSRPNPTCTYDSVNSHLQNPFPNRLPWNNLSELI